MPGSFLLSGDNGRCEAKLPVKSKEPYKYRESKTRQKGGSS